MEFSSAGSACQKRFLTSGGRRRKPLPGAASQIENLGRGSFALGEPAASCGLCTSHPLQFLPTPCGFPARKLQGNNFCSGKCFSGAKIAPSPPYTRRLCRFSKLSKFQSAKPASAKIARIKKKSRGNFCFLRQLRLQSAVTYVQMGSLACKFASLACRLSHHSDSLLTLSTSCDFAGFPNHQNLPPGTIETQKGFGPFALFYGFWAA